ncbi:ABC transporter permease subunit [Terrarubrum flagellatum]|uniref:ABC transporter permease n=1 Tax=Terrirubrum flagellatum TaxID=2895980 RepID=UPI0031455ED6
MNALPIDLSLAMASLPDMARGLTINILLTFLTLAIGLFTSLLVTLARMSKNRLVSGVAAAYVVFFRGAPLLILLYLVYYGFGQIAVVREGPLWLIFGSAFSCAIIGLVLNHTAFMVEVVRGALEAVPAGLIEASHALGISPRQTFLRIRLPLAMRYGLKAYQNEVVMFAKGTAVVSTITVNDLTSVANGIFEATYDPFTPILTAAALYWIFVNIVRLGFLKIDRYLNDHLISEEKRRHAAATRPVARAAPRRAAASTGAMAPVVREHAA